MSPFSDGDVGGGVVAPGFVGCEDGLWWKNVRRYRGSREGFPRLALSVEGEVEEAAAAAVSKASAASMMVFRSWKITNKKHQYTSVEIKSTCFSSADIKNYSVKSNVLK